MPSKKDIEAGRAFVRLFLKNDLRTQLGKALSAAGSALKSFGRKALVIGGSVAAAGTAISGALTLAANKFANAVAPLHNLALKTGSTVEELSRMRSMASQTGIDFDDMTGAIEELNIRLGEAIKDGTGPLAETFKHLGLNAKKVASLPVAERFAKIADALRGVQDQAQRGFFADEIFGGDAFKILPFLLQGSEGIKELSKQAERLGQVFSRADVQAAKDYQKAMNQIKWSLEAIWVRIGAAVAPALTDLANRMAQNVAKVVDWINTNQDLIANAMRMETAIAALKVAWAQMIVFWRTETKVFKDWFAGFTEGLAGLMIDAVAQMKKTFMGMLDLMDDPKWKWVIRAVAPGLALGKAGYEMAGGPRMTPEQIEADKEAAYKALRDEFARQFKERETGAGGVAQAEKDLEAALAKLNELLGKPRKRAGTTTIIEDALAGALTSVKQERPPPILTATYSAAAARIGGYQPGARPEEKTAEGVAQINKTAEKILTKIGEWIGQNATSIALYERFLAGWKVN